MKRPPALPEIDVMIHEPARLRVLALLAVVERADFMFLLRHTGLSRGNLSVQMSRLEEGGIVRLERSLEGNRPRTTYFLTPEGLKALQSYKRVLSRLLAGIPNGARGTTA